MDDNQNDGSLLENFQDDPEEGKEEATAAPSVDMDLSFTLPEGPSEFDPNALFNEGAADPAAADPAAADPAQLHNESVIDDAGVQAPASELAPGELPAVFSPEIPSAPMDMAAAEAPAPDFSMDTPIPGEEVAEPAESVNQMLGEAVVQEEGAHAEGAPQAAQKAPVDPTATFALVIHGPVAADIWQKASSHPALRDLNLAKEPPKAKLLVSRLTEYQTVAATLALKELSITTEPLASAPESDSEPEAVESEGAAQVNLPKDASGVFLYTGDQPPGYNVQKIEGVVSAHRSIARRFFRDMEAQEILERELAKVHKPSKIRKLFPTNAMERLFGGLFLDLQKAALSRGANGIVALRVEAFPESNSLDADLEQMRLVALGTAAVVEKA